MEILQVLHDHLAPGALDSVYQQVARLAHCKRAAQTVASTPRDFIPCAAKMELEHKGEGLPRKRPPQFNGYNSTVLAGVQGNLAIAAAARCMRRFLGPMGHVVRQNLLAAADMDQKAKSAADGDDLGAGGILNGINPKSRKRNRFL